MPKTEAEKKRRARQRANQRDQKRAQKAGELQPQQQPRALSGEEAERPAGFPSSPPAAQPNYSIEEIVGAIGQLAGVVNDLKDAMMGAIGELAQGQELQGQRIATIEQAQAQGLDTLATQSGLMGLGLSSDLLPGAIQGEQAMLVQSSSYRAMRETEAQILSEEGYNLAIPNDGHTIIVGAITEEQVKARREALYKAANESHGGLII